MHTSCRKKLVGETSILGQRAAAREKSREELAQKCGLLQRPRLWSGRQAIETCFLEGLVQGKVVAPGLHQFDGASGPRMLGEQVPDAVENQLLLFVEVEIHGLLPGQAEKPAGDQVQLDLGGSHGHACSHREAKIGIGEGSVFEAFRSEKFEGQ